MNRVLPFVAVLLVLSAAPSQAEPPRPSATDFFEKDVRPILVQRCLECHSDAAHKGGLRLTSRANVLKGTDNGPGAVAGKPDESRIIDAIGHKQALKMPKDAKLPEREIAVLTRWVEIGLPWPKSDDKIVAAGKFRITDEQRQFWSFQPVKVVAPPELKNKDWPRSDLDRYVLAGLEAKGLKPAKPADKRTLLRRATFDLTGLPPTPQEVDAFVKDDSPDAFAKVVDRLLASKTYGERWGRHWLDLVRYTDSFDARGVGSDGDIANAWRYRDWVVDAFNRDLPYDKFVTDQIAGDLVPTKDGFNRDGTIATGLLAIGNWGGGDADKEKLLTDIADDQVDVVSRTFMGLTVACARCHDHKFDPISTADYYALGGVFFSTHILPDVGAKTAGPPMLHIPLASAAEVAAGKQHAQRLADAEKRLKQETAAVLSSARWTELTKLAAEVERLRQTTPPPLAFAEGAQEGGVPDSPHAGIHDVRVHIRGRYDRLGELVPRRFPEIIAGKDQKPIASGSGRLQLAEWLTKPDHPLTARVMVNRIWQYHFGEGIVRTPSNYGKLGERPTHPELLDYLANVFVKSGWSVKQMHRLLMLSATYRQSSEADPETQKDDPDNRLFGRMVRRRLEAEAVRDSLLAASGKLDLQRGGPATRDFNSSRRTLYVMTIRSDRSGFGPLFDSADPTAEVDRRTVSTVAPQALFLLNNPFVLEQTRVLSQRIIAAAKDDKGRIRYAYQLLYGRDPLAEEERIGLAFLQRGASPEKAWVEYGQVLLCANEFIYVD